MTRAPAFPDGKRFAFTIFDDTDNSTVANTAPVYRLLHELGMCTTKSVWVYPPRGRFKGGSLMDEDYRTWILELASDGFEISLHNVGDGAFTRKEIVEGLELFRSIVSRYPRCHANHSSNPDNMYWLERRFEWPFSFLYALALRLSRQRKRSASGHDPSSPHFWGDHFRQRIQYSRNLTFNGIDTLAYDPKMPYHVDSKPYANHWFSSSDGHTVREMNDLLSKSNVDALENNGGACIVYTHFASAFVDATGRVDETFARRISYLASRPGWFVPVGTLLDHLAQGSPDSDPGYGYRAWLNVRWLRDRTIKRFRYGH